jgi:hypothetical protein
MAERFFQRDGLSCIARRRGLPFYAYLPMAVLLFACVLVPRSETLAQSNVSISTPAIIGSPTPLEKINDIRAQPLALLAKFPSAGNALASYVAKIITKEPPLIDSILSIISDTSPEQASAIGAGLVRGVRAMDGKQAASARAISAKVMKSDNIWLKTTFGAIGPRYGANADALMANLVEPDALKNVTVGDALPDAVSRVGASKRKDLFAVDENGRRKKYGESKAFEIMNRDGMIVALIASDASSNGAVSTSPSL